MLIVAWSSAWIYTQQVYLGHDLNNVDGKGPEESGGDTHSHFATTYGQGDWVERLNRELGKSKGVTPIRASGDHSA